MCVCVCVCVYVCVLLDELGRDERLTFSELAVQ